MLTKINEIRKYLNTIFVERENHVFGIIASIIAGENALLLGGAGVAKSALINELASTIGNMNYFQWLLTRYTVPEELFGALSLKELELGIYKRNMAGKLPEANIAFIDEVFKANSSILNTLLTIINEKVFHNNGTPIPCPLISLFGASNEYPEADEGLEPLYDRFVCRFWVDEVTDKRKQKSMDTTLKQDVETGNNIERLLPSELLLYSNPATKQVFLRKFAEGECLQYSTRVKEKLGEGPLVCCVDVSGSMKKPIYSGDTTMRAEWAKAVAYALWSVAQKQHRRFYLIEFNDTIIDNYEVNKPQLNRLLKVKHIGETDFFPPLNKAFSIIRENGNFKKADIVLITDGGAILGEVQLKSVNERKKAFKTHIYSIQLGTRRDTLVPFSDKVICYDGSCSFSEVFERV